MKSILAAAVLALAPFSVHAANITVPAGFRATVVFEGAGPARHLAVSARGDLYVSRQQPRGAPKAPGILALRDTDGDGKFDEAKPFGDVAGTGLRFHGGDLYATSASTLYRYHFSGGELTPAAAPDVIVSGMPTTGFANRVIAFDDQGHVFIGVGSGGNTCVDRSSPTPKTADPCTELASRGGIWRYDANRTGQAFPADGERFASGVRDLLSLDWNSADHTLYAAPQGRNGIVAGGSKLYSEDDNEMGVAEEMHRIVHGANLGWPYAHFDARAMKRMKAPEYGGKPGDVVTDNAYSTPVAVFPSHSSPLDLTFYNGRQFPAAYRGGAFIAFHGGSDGDRQQNGYNVWFVPRPPAKGFAKPVIFADGFAGADHRAKTAEFRPSSVAVAPSGALYVMESEKGRIWRIDYVGKAGARVTSR
jgi:glucose/arabinose dehydrogenase